MKKYKVEVIRLLTYTITIDALDERESLKIANALADHELNEMIANRRSVPLDSITYGPYKEKGNTLLGRTEEVLDNVVPFKEKTS